MAVERYNEAAARLEDVHDRIIRNQHLLKVAEYKLGIANEHLTARAARSTRPTTPASSTSSSPRAPSTTC